MTTVVTETDIRNEIVNGAGAEGIAMDTSTCVVIADDHSMVRHAIRQFVETYRGLKVIGEACNGARAVELAHELRPHIVEFQPIICRTLKGLIDDRLRADGNSKKARCHISHCLRAAGIGPFTCHCGRGADADRRLFWRAAVANAANEDGNIGALAPAIGVQFVENDEVQAACVLHDLGI